MTYRHPLATPTIGEEEIEAATAVLRSGHTTMGEKVEEFEEAFARRVGARHGVMVNSGSSADLLIAFALDLHGEVLIPAVTWPTHLWSWKMSKATPVLVDVDEVNVGLGVLDAITPQTAGISLAHLMGIPVEDLGYIAGECERRGVILTEDCCEALGATFGGHSVGQFGYAASWSFFFSHHITTMEGGMVTTNDVTLASRLRTLRSHGWARHLENPPRGVDPRYTFIDWGFNLRPTEVAAAIGLVQLDRLPDFLSRRRDNFASFARILVNPLVRLPRVPDFAEPSWFGIPMFVSGGRRDDLANWLEERGVETRPILAGNLIRQPACEDQKGDFPNADLVHDQGLYVGLHPRGSADFVAHLINEFD